MGTKLFLPAIHKLTYFLLNKFRFLVPFSLFFFLKQEKIIDGWSNNCIGYFSCWRAGAYVLSVVLGTSLLPRNFHIRCFFFLSHSQDMHNKKVDKKLLTQQDWFAAEVCKIRATAVCQTKNPLSTLDVRRSLNIVLFCCLQTSLDKIFTKQDC